MLTLSSKQPKWKFLSEAVFCLKTGFKHNLTGQISDHDGYIRVTNRANSSDSLIHAAYQPLYFPARRWLWPVTRTVVPLRTSGLQLLSWRQWAPHLGSHSGAPGMTWRNSDLRFLVEVSGELTPSHSEPLCKIWAQLYTSVKQEKWRAEACQVCVYFRWKW